MRNPTDIKLCIPLSHKYCLFRRPTYQLTQVVVCVILRCIILVSVCVMSGYCVISGCHVKLHHSCVCVMSCYCVCVISGCHVKLHHSCISLCHVIFFVFFCMCHFRVFCISCYYVYFVSRSMSAVIMRCQPLSHQEFCHLNFHLPSSFDFIPSLFCLFVCFIFVFYLPTPLFYFCFLFAPSSKR